MIKELKGIGLIQLALAYNGGYLRNREMVLVIPDTKTSNQLELWRGKPEELLDLLVDSYGDDMGLETETVEDLTDFLDKLSGQYGIQLFS
jgi:hypothetical protein